MEREGENGERDREAAGERGREGGREKERDKTKNKRESEKQFIGNTIISASTRQLPLFYEAAIVSHVS